VFCEFPGFNHGAEEVITLLRCYTAYICSYFLMFQDNLSIPTPKGQEIQEECWKQLYEWLIWDGVGSNCFSGKISVAVLFEHDEKEKMKVGHRSNTGKQPPTYTV
jgi:hypothetical protein